MSSSSSSSSSGAGAGAGAGMSSGSARHANGAAVKRRVSYFYDGETGNFHYGQGHPMKPHRVRMAHNLIVAYGLYKQMEVFRPSLVSHGEMTKFHSDDYINFLRLVTPDNMHEYLRQLQRFNVGEDCPVFDGMYAFCQARSTARIEAPCDIRGASHGGASHGASLHQPPGLRRPTRALL